MAAMLPQPVNTPVARDEVNKKVKRRLIPLRVFSKVDCRSVPFLTLIVLGSDLFMVSVVLIRFSCVNPTP